MVEKNILECFEGWKKYKYSKSGFFPKNLERIFRYLDPHSFLPPKEFPFNCTKETILQKNTPFPLYSHPSIYLKKLIFLLKCKTSPWKALFSLIFRNKEKALQQYNSIYFLSIHFPCHEIYINKHKREEEKLSFSSN